MRLSDNCCGSAGVYNVTQTQTSLQLLAEKMLCARQTGAAAIVTANPGCLLQIQAALRKARSPARVVHLADFLDQASPNLGSPRTGNQP